MLITELLILTGLSACTHLYITTRVILIECVRNMVHAVLLYITEPVAQNKNTARVSECISNTTNYSTNASPDGDTYKLHNIR